MTSKYFIKLFLFVFLFVFSSENAWAFNYKKIEVIEQKIEAFLPSHLKGEFDLPKKHIASKEAKIPNFIYTDKEKSVKIHFQHKNHVFAPRNITDFIATHAKMIFSIYPSATVSNSTIKHINNKDIGIIEWSDKINNKDHYNLMIVTDLDGKLMLGFLEYTGDDIDNWRIAGWRMINSINVIQ